MKHIDFCKYSHNNNNKIRNYKTISFVNGTKMTYTPIQCYAASCYYYYVHRCVYNNVRCNMFNNR